MLPGLPPAFDRVWHEGRINKLTEAGLDNSMLLNTAELYRNITNCVKYKGLIWEAFQNKQGTRQGGKTSPILNLTFHNDLIKERILYV
ncbi:hypothetical protein DPMN_031081 [Dreissena polymorpha]|uniref:Reverse transcriptase domain-containing protein n=1 Tax=Dreissena polymorpha TaxID=45954 RepID=A0A9D4RGS3_DREPO|nr:hypothetical protein DPMN_031081 [Dreissena polymorpha]